MKTDVDRIVQDAAAKYPGVSQQAVKEIVETAVATVRADLLLKFEQFRLGLDVEKHRPVTKAATKPKAKNGVSKASDSTNDKKKRKPLTPAQKAKLAENLKKARAAKAEKAKAAEETKAKRSAAMKKVWSEKKKAAKKSAKKK
jgi:hypothetical protein